MVTLIGGLANGSLVHLIAFTIHECVNYNTVNLKAKTYIIGVNAYEPYIVMLNVLVQ